MASSPASSTPSSGDVLPTSRSLLDRAKHHDGAAWQDLVELYTPLVYYWCRRAQVAPQDIPDVVQEVFRAVVAGIESFRKERPCDTFRGWLRTVTRSRLAEYFQRRQRMPAAVGGTEHQLRVERLAGVADWEEDSDEAAAEHALLLRGLESIRQQFAPQTWEAFWRVVVEGQAAPDVARDLGMRTGTVRVAKSRVLQRLRRQLGDVE